MPNSSLDQLISPEIKNDQLYDYIYQLAKNEPLQNVLEIGSSSGGGSTKAFVQGLRENPNSPQLFCVEVSQKRFKQLQETYQDYNFVKPYNVSSVGLAEFPTVEDVTQFYQQQTTYLNHYPLERILQWLNEDKTYLQNTKIPDNGIELIKQENNIDYFDLVLLDGSEFTGFAELEHIYGAKWIILDDVFSYKNYNSYCRLKPDPDYELVAQNIALRNGFSIFRKLDPNFKNKKQLFTTLEKQWESQEKQLVQKLVNFGDMVFDVGANVGDYSFLLSQEVGYFGKVYAFEPTSSLIPEFQQKIQDYDITNLELITKAVYSGNMTLTFNEFPEEFSAWNTLGTPQMLDPAGSGTIVPFAQKEEVEAITLDAFCQEKNIETIDFLKVDVEGAESDVFAGAKQLLENHKIKYIQFEISQKMLEGLNREAKETFSLLIQQGYECHRITQNAQIGEKITDSRAYYENYLAFPQLPIHFFTIVLNGEPFIRYHIDVLKKLSFPWHWHIVEGVAALKHDTAWSVKLGGKVTSNIHKDGRSIDGTSDYLDQLQAEFPENVSIYRKPLGEFWDGKQEMVNAPLEKITQECLLWQVDVDELWTVAQIEQVRYLFLEYPDKMSAYYWCWYFMGEDLVISTRNCYTQNPSQDWLRTWRYKPGYYWARHEPPILVEPLEDGQLVNISGVNPFSHGETEARGAVFQHFAYILPEQLQFKEQYYGYQNALQQWETLQEESRFPVLLREYLGWVGDDTMVDKAEKLGITPILQRGEKGWEFVHSSSQVNIQLLEMDSPRVVVDGVFFQMYNTGIARVWRSLLQTWVKTGFAEHLLVLDRGGTVPKISGIRYRTIPVHDYNNLEGDRILLQQVCDQEGADVFISTYYSFPTQTPSVFLLHDMIPELSGSDLTIPMWREKQEAINHASAFVAVSENSAKDLQKFYPEIEQVAVAHNGLDPLFSPATDEEVTEFKQKYGIQKPYFLLISPGLGYKNAQLFFEAFSQLPTKQGFDIVCTVHKGYFPEELRDYCKGVTVHLLYLSDAELRLAYGGAVALVYPSIYEGFGLPVLEAMACGCPAISSPTASIPEVAAEAALYVQPNDTIAMVDALCEVQKPSVRTKMVAQGLERAKLFSWDKMAQKLQSVLVEVTLTPLQLRENNILISPHWTQGEEVVIEELGNAIAILASHPHPETITLVIDTTGVSEEEANLLLSGVTMSLLLEQGLDLSEAVQISLTGDLSPLQWEKLRKLINCSLRDL